jgi:aldose sugar dehydrogenase
MNLPTNREFFWPIPQSRTVLVILGLALLAASSYGQRPNGVGLQVLGTRPPETPAVAGQPLETRPPNGVGQKPAFPGQTRAVAIISSTPYEVQVIAHGLNQPWGLAFLPDHKILVTEKPGAMRIVDMASGKIEHTLGGVPQVRYGGDAGLLDVIVDPDFSTTREIYFTYVESRNTDSGIVVAKAKLAPNNMWLLDVTTILRVEPSVGPTAHYGSRLLFDKNGYLFVSLGERFFSPTRDEAQSQNSMMGKILRITTDGKAAPGNPNYGQPWKENAPLQEIWSYGQRNPQGLAFNPVTGALWESEHGPQGGDEINIIEPGKNYGWPIIAYGTNYDGSKINDGLTAKEGMEQPRYYWDPAIAPSGITFYDGKLVPEWKNNLFVAALAGQHLVRLVLDGDKVVGEERLLLDQHQRIRDVQEGPDGALWVVTDDADGRLLRIGPKD